MKHYHYFLIPLALIVGGWSSSSKKNNGAMIYGTISTQQGNVFNEAQNISLSKDLQSQELTLYEVPAITENKYNEAEKKEGSVATTIPVDPKTDLAISHIDLINIKTITVPEPHHLWVYKKKGGHRERTYIKVNVEPRTGDKNTTKEYLVESSLTIHCKNGKAAHEQIPIIGIKTIEIHGYSFMNNTMEPGETQAKEKTIVCTEVSDSTPGTSETKLSIKKP